MAGRSGRGERRGFWRAGRRGGLAGWVLAVGLGPTALAAQPASLPEATDASREVRFLPEYRFHLDAARLGDNGPQFDWRAEFGGDVDLLDVGWGRLNGLARFEAILGHERGPFDPTQGNYTLQLMLTWRRGATEIGGVYHHVSRHLSDRPKSVAVDWNMVGVAASRSFARGRSRATGSARLLVATKRSFVDYRTEWGLGAAGERTLTPRMALLTRGEVTVRGVVAERFGRGTLLGGRLEGGVRLNGGRGALELVLAVERRIDADPLALGPRTWALAGFRLLSR